MASGWEVNADGSDLHRVSPQGFDAFEPRWSPDGSRLVFTLRRIVDDEQMVVPQRADIYTGTLDGSDLQRLTTDGFSGWPNWTDDGRVTFTRFIELESGAYAVEGNWVMDADGSNPTRLGTTLAELSAAGCRRCVYPVSGLGRSDAYWQP